MGPFLKIATKIEATGVKDLPAIEWEDKNINKLWPPLSIPSPFFFFREILLPVFSQVRNSTSSRKTRGLQRKSGRNKVRRLGWSVACLPQFLFVLLAGSRTNFFFHNSYVTREACLVPSHTRKLLISAWSSNTPPPATRHWAQVLGVINPLQQSIADVCVSLSDTQLTSLTTLFSFVKLFCSNRHLNVDDLFLLVRPKLCLVSSPALMLLVESATSTLIWQQTATASLSICVRWHLSGNFSEVQRPSQHTHTWNWFPLPLRLDSRVLWGLACTSSPLLSSPLPTPSTAPDPSNCYHIFSPSSCLSFPAGLDLLLMLTLVLSSGFRLLLFPEKLYKKVWRFLEARHNIYTREDLFFFSLSLSFLQAAELEHSPSVLPFSPVMHLIALRICSQTGGDIAEA